MKFAAIADVHGNIAALEAVLADIAALGIADVVNLGDHVSGPLEAARTADLLIARGFPSIRGDQDRRLMTPESCWVTLICLVRRYNVFAAAGLTG
jgi:predicted phosphodiesterase